MPNNTKCSRQIQIFLTDFPPSTIVRVWTCNCPNSTQKNPVEGDKFNYSPVSPPLKNKPTLIGKPDIEKQMALNLGASFPIKFYFKTFKFLSLINKIFRSLRVFFSINYFSFFNNCFLSLNFFYHSPRKANFRGFSEIVLFWTCSLLYNISLKYGMNSRSSSISSLIIKNKNNNK